MKNIVKNIGLFTILSFIAVSCKKDEIKNEGSIPISPTEIRYELNNIPLEKVAKSSMVQNTNKSHNGSNYIYDYVLLATNPDDADDEKINNLLFKLTEATAPLIKNVDFK